MFESAIINLLFSSATLAEREGNAPLADELTSIASRLFLEASAKKCDIFGEWYDEIFIENPMF